MPASRRARDAGTPPRQAARSRGDGGASGRLRRRAGREAGQEACGQRCAFACRQRQRRSARQARRRARRFGRGRAELHAEQESIQRRPVRLRRGGGRGCIAGRVRDQRADHRRRRGTVQEDVRERLARRLRGSGGRAASPGSRRLVASTRCTRAHAVRRTFRGQRLGVERKRRVPRATRTRRPAGALARARRLAFARRCVRSARATGTAQRARRRSRRVARERTGCLVPVWRTGSNGPSGCEPSSRARARCR